MPTSIAARVSPIARPTVAACARPARRPHRPVARPTRACCHTHPTSALEAPEGLCGRDRTGRGTGTRRRRQRGARPGHPRAHVRDPDHHQAVRRAVPLDADGRPDPADLLLAPWPGVHQRRLRRAPSPRRPRRGHLPRLARPPRQGCAAAGAVGRVPRSGHRHVQGQGRADAHHPPGVGADGHHRHRRRRHPGRQRPRARGPARRHRPGDGRELRRRRQQHRRLPRGPEHGRGVEAARDLRLPEQPVRRAHAAADGHRGRPDQPARPGLRHGRDHASTATTRSPCGTPPARPWPGPGRGRGRR